MQNEKIIENFIDYSCCNFSIYNHKGDNYYNILKKEVKIMKILETFKKLNVKRKLIIIAVLAVIVAGIIIFLLSFNPKPKANTDILISRLQKSSELTTAKFKYTGITEFKDGGVKILNRSDFIMVYEATARIGFDLEDVEISADDINKKIYVKVPKAEVKDVNVDTSSIKYFDEGFALFNVNSKEDANKGVELAKEEAKKEAADIGILEMADKQSQVLIEGLLANAIPKGYTIEFKS